MTYATEKKRIGREPLTVVEIDLDTCSLTFSVGACTASGAAGSECYNTRSTCQDTPNYAKTTKTYRFCESSSNLPAGIDMIPCITGSVNFTPTRITPGKGLGFRGAVTINLLDFTHHDRGIDQYVSTRSYTPEEQGTYFGKLLARNPYFHGRIMRVRSGYITDPWNWDNFESRTYVIEKFDGPTKNHRVKITAKDILKLADDDRSQAPIASNGILFGDITDTATTLTLFPSGIGSEYGSTGSIRISTEIMTYTRSSDVMTIVRAQHGSTASSHSDADTVQDCLVYTNENVVNIVNNLLVNYAGVSAAYIPFDDTLPGDEWDQEKDIWLASNDYTTVISEPTGVKTLLEELTEQSMFELWWDEINQLIKLKALAPPLGNATVTSIDDSSNFIQESVEIKTDQGLRVSQVWISYGVIDFAEDIKGTNLALTLVNADLTQEGSDLYGSAKVNKILSRWLDSSNSGQVLSLGSRLLARYKNPPRIIKFSLDAKDSSISTGDIIEVDTEELQDTTGANDSVRFEIVEKKEAVQGERYEYMGVEYPFTGRYGFVGKTGLLDYSSESDANKQAYAFISPAGGADFSDSTEPYKII